MIFEEVKSILADQFGVDKTEIASNTNLQGDLGADSLDVVDLVITIEEKFNIKIPDEDIEKIKTVSDLVDYIEYLT